MNTLLSRSLILVLAPLTLSLTACVGAEGAEGEDEDTAVVDSAPIQAGSALNPDLLKGYLTTMWKRQLNTSKDPVNGKWYTSGANGTTPGGLYGALNLRPATDIVLDKNAKKCTPQSQVFSETIVDNRNGKRASTGHVTLTTTYSTGSTSTHDVQNSLSLGAGYEFTAKATLFGIGGEATGSVNIDYTHSWGKSSSTSQGVTTGLEASQDYSVPAGKRYKFILNGTLTNCKIPYTATIGVSGFTETWFSGKVDGHYNYQDSASTAFANIGKWNIAGDDSSSFTSAGIVQRGTLSTSVKSKVYISHVVLN